MGCCLSKGQALYIDVPREVSSTDEWTLRQKSFLDGCKLLPYTAACPSSYPYQCLTRVVLGDGHLFAALWEGKGGSQAARHCVSACYDLVLERLKAGDEPSAALQKTFQQLDEAYLASNNYPDLVKAGVGATGTMMLLDTRTNRCHIARLGKALPFATTTKGSFNTTTVEVKDLIPFSNNARSRQSSSTAPNSSTPQQQQDQQQWDPVTSGVTHAIGLGCGKREHLRKTWLQHQEQQRKCSGAAGGSPAERTGRPQRVPKISNECEVYVSQLSTADENLVIAAEGLCQVSPPREIATLLQHFSAGTLNDAKRALCAIKEQQLELLAQQQQDTGGAAAAKGVSRTTKGGRAVASKRKAADADVTELQQDRLAELSTPTNVASIVMHQALGKSLEKFNKAMWREQQQHQQQDMQHQQQQAAVKSSKQGRQHGRGQPGAAYDVTECPMELSYGELTSLPLHVDMNAFTTGKGPISPVQLPDWYPEGGLSKADVHGDMGVVVIALNWPRPPDALRCAPAVTPLRPGPHALRRRPEAEWRWMLLRLHVKARQAYRRDLRKAWWQLVVDVQAAAEIAARQAEVLAWKTKGAAVKVNLTGAVVDSETPANFLRAHTTPSSANRHPHRQPTTAATPGRRTGGGGGGSGGSPSTQGLSQPVASNSGHYSSSSTSTAVTAGPQQPLPSSLPDVAARSQRSTGGGMRGGVVAAAVAALNNQSPSDSPRSGTLSHRSTTSSTFNAPAAAAAPGKRGGLYLSAVQTEMPVDMMPDTAQDLDSPTKALDSPNKFASAGAWATPPGHKVGARGGGGGDTAWSPSSTASTHRASPGPGGQAGAASSAYSHRGLSLRSSSRAAAAAKPTSPAAAGAPDAWRGTPSRQSGAYVTAGVTGRRPTSGGAVGQGGRTSSGTPASGKTYDLRLAARKPAARW